MATKVDKRQVRKEKMEQQLSENAAVVSNNTKVEKKKRETKNTFWGSDLGKWCIFAVQILLLMFIFTFGKQ